jgi:uncharacterized protein YcnI
MNRSMTRMSAALAVSSLALASSALPAGANVNIPEGGAVTPDSVFLINFQAQGGCDGLPMDTLEVTIPSEVDNPVPEDVPGWTVETETTDDDVTTLVRWSGASLDPETFLEFGMRLIFPDDAGATIEFPVIQRCGLEEVTSSPTVTLTPRFGPRDIIALSEAQDALRADIEALDARLGSVDPKNIHVRVTDTENAIENLRDRLDELGRRISESESAGD